MSPFWIAIGSTVPLALGLVVAAPLWYMRHEIIGNITGATLIFMTTVGMIAREWMELENKRLANCPDTETFCLPDPGNFNKFALYAFLGLAQVVVLFLVSLRVERSIRNRGVAPEWRS